MKIYFFVYVIIAMTAFPCFAEMVVMKSLECEGYGDLWNADEYRVIASKQALSSKLIEGSKIVFNIKGLEATATHEESVVYNNEFYQDKDRTVVGILSGSESGDPGTMSEKTISFSISSSTDTNLRCS